MATDPTFFGTPTLQAAVISATAYGGSRTTPTGATSIYTGSTSVATLIRRIDYKNLGTSVAGLIDLWLSPDSGTTFYQLPYSAVVTAITGSTTLDSWQSSIAPDAGKGLILPAAATAWRLYAAASVTQTTAVQAVVYGATA